MRAHHPTTPISGKTHVYGIFGWPVEHSASPAMQNAAFAAAGMDAVYVPFAVRPEALERAVAGARALGVRGFNVTLPHKHSILPLLDEVEEDARVLGAVNAVVRSGDRLLGINTDGPGLVRSLEEARVSVRDRRVTVLGAGGAARAAIVGLARAGAVRVTVLARRTEAAQALLRDLAPALGEVPSDAGGMGRDMAKRFAETDLLVQATSGTLGTGKAAAELAASLPVSALPAGAAVVDLVYEPRVTTVLEAAGKCGAHTVGGLGMLLHQGALAFERWTGRPAPLEAMRDALESPT